MVIFWHLECSLLDCINYISSSIVIEIPVSSAWCVNVIQISFYSKKKKKKRREKTILPECYLCIKHFGSYIWLFISVLLLPSLNWVESGLSKCQWQQQTFLPVVEDFFQDAQLCYPKHRRRLMADCGMKVNVRIKKRKRYFISLQCFFGMFFLMNFKAVLGFFGHMGAAEQAENWKLSF